MYQKYDKDYYANVPGSTRRNAKPEPPNEPLYDNTASYQQNTYGNTASDQEHTYDNTASYQQRPNGNTASDQQPMYENTASYQPRTNGNTASDQQPMYENTASYQPRTNDNTASSLQHAYGNTASYQQPTNGNTASGQQLAYGNTASGQQLPYGNTASSQQLAYGNTASYQQLTNENTASGQQLINDNTASSQQLPYGNTASSQQLPYGNTASSQQLAYGNTASYQQLINDNTASSQQLAYGNTASYQPRTNDNTASSQQLAYGNTASYQQPTNGNTASSQQLAYGNTASYQPRTNDNSASNLYGYDNTPSNRQTYYGTASEPHALYNNTATNYQRYYESTRGAYARNRQKASGVYENVASASAGPSAYSNVHYPLYDNIYPVDKAGLLQSRSRTSLYSSVGYPSSGYSSISDLSEVVSFDNDVEYFVSTVSRSRVSSTSGMYETICQPINNCRRELPSTYSSRSLPRSRRHHDIDSLADILVKSLTLKNRKKKFDFYANDKCGLCGEVSPIKDLVYTTSGLCHTKCLNCTHCGKLLSGKPFYYINSKPYCDQDYLVALDKCYICKIPILDRKLKATGCSYHFDCFRCVICSKLLEGIPFTVDADNRVFCVDDFHKKFAPKCGTCKLPISPVPGVEETIRLVALDQSFHIKCFKCEDCDILLGKEPDGNGCYPLDKHLLCKSCNSERIKVLTTFSK